MIFCSKHLATAIVWKYHRNVNIKKCDKSGRTPSRLRIDRGFYLSAFSARSSVP
jgi:hypothetical protein